MLAQHPVLAAEQQEPAGDEHGDQDQQKRRQDAPDPPRVEIQQAEGAAPEPLEDDRRDEKTGDDEEHVDPGEAAAQEVRGEMEGHDRQDRNRPQAIDVGPICSVRDHFLVLLWRRDGGRCNAGAFRGALRPNAYMDGHVICAKGIKGGSGQARRLWDLTAAIPPIAVALTIVTSISPRG